MDLGERKSLEWNKTNAYLLQRTADSEPSARNSQQKWPALTSQKARASTGVAPGTGPSPHAAGSPGGTQKWRANHHEGRGGHTGYYE
jgi:hypothetical protein